MKTAVIIGSSGLIGKELTKLLLEDERYTKINALVRKPLEINHEKLVQIRYDFDWPEGEHVHGEDFFCCLGTTIKKAGSQSAFRKVDYNYIIQTAETALSNGVSKMALVSSIGASTESKVFYSKVKGETEEALGALNFESLHIMRPSLLLGDRPDLRMAEIIGAFVSTAFSFAIPDKYKAIEAKDVAKAMIQEINSDKKGINILESDEISASIKS